MVRALGRKSKAWVVGRVAEHDRRTPFAAARRLEPGVDQGCADAASLAVRPHRQWCEGQCVNRLGVRPHAEFAEQDVADDLRPILGDQFDEGEACSPQMSVARRSNSAVFSPAAASKALSDRALLRPVLLMAL